jgi:hypothetical protein
LLTIIIFKLNGLSPAKKKTLKGDCRFQQHQV